MLFCLNPRANRRIEKMPPFLFLKRCFYRFFATLLVFHGFLQLFINHYRWMRLILFWHSEWRVKVQKSKRDKTTISLILRRDRSKSLESRPLVLSSLSYLLFFFYLRSDSQKTTNKARYDAICVQECPNFNTFGVTGFTANVLRAPGCTVK